MAFLLNAFSAQFNKQNNQAVYKAVNDEMNNVSGDCGYSFEQTIENVSFDLTDCNIGSIEVDNSIGNNINVTCFMNNEVQAFASQLAAMAQNTSGEQSFGAFTFNFDDQNNVTSTDFTNSINNQLDSICGSHTTQGIQNVKFSATACNAHRIAVDNSVGGGFTAGCQMYNVATASAVQKGTISQADYAGGFQMPTWAWIALAVVGGLILLLVLATFLGKRRSSAPTPTAAAASSSGLDVGKLAELAELAA
jgi:hypothetical protein